MQPSRGRQRDYFGAVNEINQIAPFGEVEATVPALPQCHYCQALAHPFSSILYSPTEVAKETAQATDASALLPKQLSCPRDTSYMDSEF